MYDVMDAMTWCMEKGPSHCLNNIWPHRKYIYMDML